MKTLLSLIYVLIPINVVVALLCMVFVMASRQQQAQMTAEIQTSPYQPETVNGEIKEKLAYEQEQLIAKQQQYEQKIKKLEEKLKISQTPLVKSPEVKQVQQSVVNVAVAVQPPPVNLPPKIAFSPSASPRNLVSPQGIVPQPSQPYLTSSRDFRPRLNSSPSTSPSSASPKSFHSGSSEKERVQDFDNDHKIVPKELIAPPNLPQSQPQASIPPTQDKKSLVKNPNNKKAPSIPLDSISYANDISTGLLVAYSKGQIKYGTKIYKQVQTAILLLRHGASKEEAIRQSKVSQNTLEQLIEWGANRPNKNMVKPAEKDEKLITEGITIANSRQIDKISNNKLKNSQKELNYSDSISYANDIATGLAIAHDKGQIKYGTKMYRQVQTAIVLLRRGVSKEEAIRQSRVSRNILEQLVEWGANRPGRLNHSADNSEVFQNN